MAIPVSISVVIPAKNEAAYIIPCLTSLLTQTLCPAEIVIVDGGSQDTTVELCEQFAATSPVPVRIFVCTNGLAAQRETGLHVAQQDWIACLDSDCIAPPTWLETLHDAWERGQERYLRLGAIAGPHIIPPKSSVLVHLIELMKSSLLGGFQTYQVQTGRKVFPCSHIPLANALLRKDVLVHIHFDPRCSSVAEDGDFSIQLLEHGHSLLWCSSAPVMHHLQTTYISWFTNMLRYGKGRAFLMKKYPRYHIARPYYSLPLLALLLVMIGSVIVPPLAWTAFWLYTLVVFFYSGFLLSRHGLSPMLTPALFCLFLGTHFSFAWGQLTFFLFWQSKV